LQPEHLERFSNISSCPTQFQRYILGTDYRVHVVGEEIFACEVISTADDYRYPTGDSPVVKPYTLPAQVEERCRRTAATMQLWFAGIDLRQTPE
jgi:glutathione synthase/RimK-type ligase-like ATP-grasp enzyme